MKGWWKMGRFNLLYEPWISVMADARGKIENVSLIDLFKNAHKYYRLAGETPAQDFAILRFLLAIMHTVFSRFDAQGEKFEWIDLDEKFIQTNEIHRAYLKKYEVALKDSWKELWDKESLPNIINDYLQVWEDRFNLYDEKYPFYQVTKEDLESENIIIKDKSGRVNAEQFNRLVSESNNTFVLFSPKDYKSKNEITDSSFVRWLISYQGYTGTADKAKFPSLNTPKGKGWLLDIGGVYLEGSSIKETLLLNMTRISDFRKQRPVWEKTFNEITNDLLYSRPDNLAELYTNYSRIVYIDSFNETPQYIRPYAFPELDKKNFFCEQMTIWRYDEKENIEVPCLHDSNKSFWRSFGQISLAGDGRRKPGIIDWYNILVNEKLIESSFIRIKSVGLSRELKSSTWTIIDEIYDEINVYNEVLADVKIDGWAERITLIVEKTKEVISFDYKNFLQKINKIRNLNREGFVNTGIQEAYFNVDLYFREWLASITIEDQMEVKQKEWEIKLRNVMREESLKILKNASKRDFLGNKIEQKDQKGKKETIYSNVSIAQNEFSAELNKKLAK
ncbi:MAG: type I-E CRISPR-associated protein Cse1/CasA [Gallicola sp.]|nr:type I-E CRISPR-associated protein Cse1/CasA [Gallicola sp.]